MPSTTREYLQPLVERRGSAIVVSTMTSAKVWPMLSDTPLDINYLPSAMGHASDIAIGIALARPDRPVICLNGDGSLVMNLGTLLTAAHAGIENLSMFLLLNGKYELGGRSPVPGSRTTDWLALARAAGWRNTAHFHGAGAFEKALPGLLTGHGRTFAVLEVEDPVGLEMSLPSTHPAHALRTLRQHLTVEHNPYP